MGYPGIVFLMTIESSFIPFPSEVIIPPAACLAEQGEMNYFLALSLGRKIIYGLSNTRTARLFLINENKIKKAEDSFLKYGNFSTFFGRLVPALRQLISIPAGFSKMKFKNFISYTFLGSSLWIVILASLGYLFGSNQELLAKYYRQISFFFFAIALLLLAGFLIKFKKNKN